jgi:hypothetical protein
MVTVLWLTGDWPRMYEDSSAPTAPFEWITGSQSAECPDYRIPNPLLVIRSFSTSVPGHNPPLAYPSYPVTQSTISSLLQASCACLSSYWAWSVFSRDLYLERVCPLELWEYEPRQVCVSLQALRVLVIEIFPIAILVLVLVFSQHASFSPKYPPTQPNTPSPGPSFLTHFASTAHANDGDVRM